jgi:hypothetical protein
MFSSFVLFSERAMSHPEFLENLSRREELGKPEKWRLGKADLLRYTVENETDSSSQEVFEIDAIQVWHTSRKGTRVAESVTGSSARA